MTANADRGERLSALMASAQDGDAAAYRRLLGEAAALLRHAIRRKRSFLAAAEIEDLVQDVLLSVHQARNTYDPTRPFTPWLMAIARSRLADAGRRYRRTGAHEVLTDVFPETFSDPEANREQELSAEAAELRRAVADLPAGQREAIELLKLKEWSLKEASAATGQSETALKVAVHRAIKALRVNSQGGTMSVETETLIDRLAAEMAPVRRLPAPTIRAVLWLLAGLPLLPLAVMIEGLDPRVLTLGDDARLATELAATFATAVLAAVAAFTLTVPGRPARGLLALTGVASGIWIASIGKGCLDDFLALGAAGLAVRADWGCFLPMLAVGMLPLGLIVTMLRRGAPVAPRGTFALAGLAVAAFANLALQLFHAADASIMVLVWHIGGAVALASLAGAAGPRLMSRWQSRDEA